MLEALRKSDANNLKLRLELPGAIREYRKKHKLHLMDLAERMEISSGYLSDIEHGRRHLSAVIIESLLIHLP